MKESTLKRNDLVGYHLYDIREKAKLSRQKTDRGFQGQEKEKGADYKGLEGTFWSNRNILYLAYGRLTFIKIQDYTHKKKSEFCLNNPDFKKKVKGNYQILNSN